MSGAATLGSHLSPWPVSRASCDLCSLQSFPHQCRARKHLQRQEANVQNLPSVSFFPLRTILHTCMFKLEPPSKDRKAAPIHRGSAAPESSYTPKGAHAAVLLPFRVPFVICNFVYKGDFSSSPCLSIQILYVPSYFIVSDLECRQKLPFP